MGYGIRAEVWGDYALFSRPELKTERVSYDVMTPSAARGLLEAVMWHPGMRWHIDRIHVINPIVFTNIRRNEVKSKIKKEVPKSMVNSGTIPFLATSNDIMQRASLMLKDVRYVIEAHFELTNQASPTDTVEKFYAMSCRRLREGKCYHQPCFGTRECTAHFRLIEDKEELPPAIDETRDLGLMLFDMDYSEPEDIQPMFFRAKLNKGIMQIKDCEVFR